MTGGIHMAQAMSLPQLDTCFDLITFNGAKILNVEDQYGLDVGKPASFLVLDAISSFEALLRQSADVLRNGEKLFKKPSPAMTLNWACSEPYALFDA